MKNLMSACLALALLAAVVLPAKCQTSDTSSPVPRPPSVPTETPPAPAATTATALPPDPAKEAEIRKLLELTGTVKRMNMVKHQILDMFRQQHTGMSDEMWNRLAYEMDVNELLEKLIPLYEKYYTLEDLQKMNEFYASPTGQKINAVSPDLTRETMQLSQAWGRRIGMQVAEEVEKRKQEQQTAAASSNTDSPPAPAPAPNPGTSNAPPQ